MMIPAKIKQQHVKTLATAIALRETVRNGSDSIEILNMRLRFSAACRETLTSFQAAINCVSSVRCQDIPRLSYIIECDREMRRAYSEHLARWTPSAMGSDARGYMLDVCQLVARIEPHIRLLESELYEPALRIGLILDQ